MQFTGKETELLKIWVIKKLEDISDADADVLADYALALVSTDDAVNVARTNCIDNLKDFLPNNAERFVDELFEAISSKSYDPTQPKTESAPPAPHAPSRPKHDAEGQMIASRKRSFQWDKDEGGGQNGHFQGGSRPIKHLRRGGRGGFERGGRQRQEPTALHGRPSFSQPGNVAQGPPLPCELPPWDPNDPLPAMMAMQQIMGAMPGLQDGPAQNGPSFRPPGITERCRDYGTRGFCAAGASCPYEHSDPYVIPTEGQEYAPSDALINFPPGMHADFHVFNDRGRGGLRGRGRGRGANNFRGGGGRSDFSQLGPNKDGSNTSVVVEQIPEEELNERSVRAFFSEFGSIEEVTIHPDRKLAIVQYDNKPAARAAYESPKVVFDNRFVKVYWYKSGPFRQQQHNAPPSKAIKTEDIEMQDEAQQCDQVELARRQEEAQRKHDEARRKREEAEKQKASLDQKLKAMEAERKKMADLLAKKSAKDSSPPGGSSPIVKYEEDDSEQTKGLKAQLARLEAEAKELGIDPDAPESNGFYSFGGSSYRSRGGYRGRGRSRGFYQPYRGSWTGDAGRGGAVMRLDNRPKTIAVTFASNNYDASDEALRQFMLFNNMEAVSILRHPGKDDTALVTFKQRYEGENFMVAARAEIPHAGKVETSWYSKPAEVRSNGTHYEPVESKIESEGDAGDREMYENGEREEQDLDRYA